MLLAATLLATASLADPSAGDGIAELIAAQGAAPEVSNESGAPTPSMAAPEPKGPETTATDASLGLEPDDEGSVAELLASDDLAVSEVELSEARVRWALQDLLALGFAHSPTAEAAVQRALTPHLLRDAAFLSDLERQTALAYLRPIHLHEATRPGTVTYDIPIADHALVDAWIDYFTGRGRWFFEKWLARSRRYAPIMQPILEQYGVPQDLLYLAMIESGFSAKAYSVAAASGFWQFIRSTGATYGMRMDAWVDERRDFIIATHAAARYLAYLKKYFGGDWHLAWAGYNGGEGRVRRALNKHGVTSFWELVARRALPKETQHYVPKIIAAAIVAKNPERYGFGHVGAESLLEYDEIEVDDAIDLRLVARELGVDAELLRDLNPQLIYDITPPRRRLTLRVPAGMAERASTWIASLPPSERLDYAHHRVAKGDTLSGIAKRFGTSVAMIQEFNRVSARALRVGQQLIIPSLRGAARPATHVTVAKPTQVAAAQRANKVESTRTERPHTTHVVSAGDSLWSIAQRYGVTVEDVKRWNQLRGSRIQAGATLKIYDTDRS